MPKLPQDTVVIIDPGHGFEPDKKWQRPLTTIKNGIVEIINSFKSGDSRDINPNFYREDLGTLDIANAVAQRLEEYGYNVYVTRNDGRAAMSRVPEILNSSNAWQKKFWPSWKWIVKLCKDTRSDVMLSLHTNAGGGTGTNGFVTEPQGIPMVKAILTEVTGMTGLKNRKIEDRDYMVLRGHSNGMAALLELGFHDGLADLKFLIQESNRRALGQAIADGLHKFLTKS